MENFEENQLIETLDEEGNVVKFVMDDVVDVEGQEYALLLPVDVQKGEEDHIILMRLIKDGDDYMFERIDDDAEFEKVAAFLDSLEDEEE